MKRSELFFTALLVPLDLVMLLLGFSVAYYLRDTGVTLAPDATLTGQLGRILVPGTLGDILPYREYLRYLTYLIPAMLAVFGLTGLYAMRGSFPWTKRLVRIFLGVSVGLFGILLLFLLRNDFFLPRSTVLYSWLFCTVFVVAGRLSLQGIQKLLRRYRIGIIRLGIIGTQQAVNQIKAALDRGPHSLHRVEYTARSLDVDELIDRMDADLLDELIVVNERYSTEELIRLRNHCLEHQVSFTFVPALFTALESSYQLRSELPLPVIEVQPTPLDGWGRVVKRIFDIAGALLIAAIFSPIVIVVCLAIAITSPGPLFYKNIRIGKHRSTIGVWKFRTMHYQYCTGPGYDGDAAFAELLRKNPELDAEYKQYRKLKKDPRVSGIGKFLRKTSLDELPQLFNVLKGDISLVGPRPILHEEAELFGEVGRILFTVRPGLTGLWQVSGRNNLSFDERVRLDARYIEHWSLWWDILICLRTIRVFFPSRNTGAY
jgi:exopolysaccharide biosynthesis polyprenyl glycosylphosphotransferase